MYCYILYFILIYFISFYFFILLYFFILFYFILFYFILFYIFNEDDLSLTTRQRFVIFLKTYFKFVSILNKILNNISASFFVRFVYILENMANSSYQFIIGIAYLSFCYNQFKYSCSNIISLLSSLYS